MTKITNIFISQPMSGLSDEQIEDMRREIIDKAWKSFGVAFYLLTSEDED